MKASWLAVLLFSLTVHAADDPLLAESRAKALFLYNATNVVEWPADAFADPRSPLRLCVYGAAPVHEALEAVDGTLIGERRLQIVSASTLNDLRDGCHILFIGRDRQVNLPQFWSEISYLYVLSVGEQVDFTARGGGINILRGSDGLQLDINVNILQANGLFINSDLLSLVREIELDTSTTR